MRRPKRAPGKPQIEQRETATWMSKYTRFEEFINKLWQVLCGVGEKYDMASYIEEIVCGFRKIEIDVWES